MIPVPTNRRISRTSPRISSSRLPKFFVAAIVLTAVLPLMIHLKLTNNEHHLSNNNNNNNKPTFLPKKKEQRSSHNYKDTFVQDPSLQVAPTKYDKIVNAANQVESHILEFFQGESRALVDGVPYGSPNNYILKERLIQRISDCHSNNAKDKNCTLKVVFIGSAQTSGRDNFYNSSFPFFTKQLLTPIAQAANLQLQVYNHALDSDLSREGPQTTHMCVGNLVGNTADVDVIAWDMDGNLQRNPPAQVEAFLRWAALQQPAMMIINKGGPHGRSRRGTKRMVVNLGPGHDAVVYEDTEPTPEARQDDYRKSSSFRQRWQKGRNNFWETLFEKYGRVVDFASVDPEGSIWHLDHLLEFSNMAFDADKVLPLVDCGKAHPPPCNQVPDFVEKHLARANLTIDDIPKDDSVGGAVCTSMMGCRHLWYGGTKSHMLRAQLNALSILRALRDAARALQRSSANKKNPQQERSLVSMSTLPDPEFCSAAFCSLEPKCMTSYVPNLGLHLGDAIVAHENEIRPRKGASHFADDPAFQIRNLDIRFAPLGYVDRKFAYRLSVNDDNKKHRQKEADEPDASSVIFAFSTVGAGPLVICEPPCFIDSCSKNRKMPIVDHITLELDGQPVDNKAKIPQPAEVGGPFCKVVSASVPAGEHTLRIFTSVVSPAHVMISHVIPFS